jgi:hypothetical protein
VSCSQADGCRGVLPGSHHRPSTNVREPRLSPGAWAPELRVDDVEEAQLAEDLQEVAEQRQDPKYQRDVEDLARSIEEERHG